MTHARAIDQITGLVAGRRPRQPHGRRRQGPAEPPGMPLALHALLRLQPQVGPVMINANRNLAAYESLGVPVWPDALPDYPGPAGRLAGRLERCETPYLVTVPCDTPHFPTDLVPRAWPPALVRRGRRHRDGRHAGRRPLQPQPVFCLMQATLMESLVAFLQAGERKIDRWTAAPLREVVFDDARPFFNANTLEELQRLQSRQAWPCSTCRSSCTGACSSASCRQTRK
jgi:molybdopterin-guanine dinucleotide biosynthesis protein A